MAREVVQFTAEDLVQALVIHLEIEVCQHVPQPSPPRHPVAEVRGHHAFVTEDLEHVEETQDPVPRGIPGVEIDCAAAISLL
jgi:hypothetical protein